MQTFFFLSFLYLKLFADNTVKMLLLCSSEGGVEQSDSSELSSSHRCGCALEFFHIFSPLRLFTPPLASGRLDRPLPPNLKRQTVVILKKTTNDDHCFFCSFSDTYLLRLFFFFLFFLRRCWIKVAASSSVALSSAFTPSFSALTADTVQPARRSKAAGRQAGWLLGWLLGSSTQRKAFWFQPTN